jgi:hypothetical protein
VRLPWPSPLQEMLQFMARENVEDYNADFLFMFESWEAAIEYSGRGRENVEAVDISRLLGWTDKGAAAAVMKSPSQTGPGLRSSRLPSVNATYQKGRPKPPSAPCWKR